jgi:hypothetical protein
MMAVAVGFCNIREVTIRERPLLQIDGWTNLRLVTSLKFCSRISLATRHTCESPSRKLCESILNIYHGQITLQSIRIFLRGVVDEYLYERLNDKGNHKSQDCPEPCRNAQPDSRNISVFGIAPSAPC